MPVFTYRATDDHGRIVDGQIEAKDQGAVVDRLQRLSFFPLDIRVAEETAGEKGRQPLLRWRRGRRVAFFTGQLATLLEAGLPVDRSLAILEELTDDRDFSRVIARVRTSVEEGSTLADALGEQASWFGELHVNMVRAGESGGALEIITRRLAEFLEESQRVRDFIVSSLTYPLFLLVFSGAALTLIFTAVLPRFVRIFEDMGDVVPLPARVLMGMSRFVGSWGWLLALSAAALAVLFFSWTRTPAGHLWWDRSRLGWPLLGDLLAKLETARFARTLGTLMAGGVLVLQAVDIVSHTVGNRHIASFMGEIRDGLRRGEGLVAPLRKVGIFPPLFIHMAAVGEETGRMEEMLLKTAGIFEGEVETATKGILALLEPVVLVVLGLALGSIIISILWAIFSVYSISF